MDSPFRWAGSKKSLLPLLSRIVPQQIERYIEPFAGSACLFFARRPKTAILADFNEALINSYQVIRSNHDDVHDVLSTLAQDGSDYYAVRALYNQNPDDLRRAAFFLYLNRFGFNGVYRTNRLGKYNVPRGTRTGSLQGRSYLGEVAQVLENVELRCADFRSTIQEAREGDLVYADPPYVTTHRQTYGEYGYGSFGSTIDLDDLKQTLSSASERGAKIILSFGDASPLSDLLNGWVVRQFETQRRISSSATSRATKYDELIATNFPS